MLPIVLVSLLVSSVLAGPVVNVAQYNVNEIAPARDNGRAVSSYITDRSFELVDGGDTNIYILTIQQILNDLANAPDANSQAIAVGQTIALLGELAYGIPGDACEAAALVNAVATRSGVRGALNNYLARLAANIDLIAQVGVNPNAYRYSTGPKANCAGGGRTYQFEAAWDIAISNSNAYNVGYINEEYCAAKRLYGALNSRSNNVGAAVTAAVSGPVAKAVEYALVPLSDFLKTVVSGANAGSAAAAAKNALIQAGGRVQL
uniref:Fibroin light chain n=1 Tax=Cnaphalocrocis medinalis TaxID=437488 RepID=A0AA96ZRC6_CNAME|nr:fibroin light chain [Cnaphalocrocis medinalis]